MKIWFGFKIVILFLVIGAVALQAVQAKDEPLEFKSETVKIQYIVKDESNFDGKYVVIEGKIQTECPMGCWFIADDGTAQIYVDIKPNNFVIPQKRGDNVKVYGEVTKKNGDPQLIGKIVEIDGEIYR
ncbi:MAG: hypothetical protein ACE14P_14930 [Methanotrichaceae archaeon]